jgi:hypothetical protein
MNHCKVCNRAVIDVTKSCNRWNSVHWFQSIRLLWIFGRHNADVNTSVVLAIKLFGLDPSPFKNLFAFGDTMISGKERACRSVLISAQETFEGKVFGVADGILDLFQNEPLNEQILCCCSVPQCR